MIVETRLQKHIYKLTSVLKYINSRKCISLKNKEGKKGGMKARVTPMHMCVHAGSCEIVNSVL